MNVIFFIKLMPIRWEIIGELNSIFIAEIIFIINEQLYY
jgi:hypothetical protein